MKINLNTKKKQKTIKKLSNTTKKNNYNFYNLKLPTHNNLIINSYTIKWSKCNTHHIKYFNKGSFDRKESMSSSLFLNNLAILDKRLKCSRPKLIKIENKDRNLKELVDKSLLNKESKQFNRLDKNIDMLNMDNILDPKKINTPDNHSTKNNNNNNNNNSNSSDNNSDNNYYFMKLIEKEEKERNKELKVEEEEENEEENEEESLIKKKMQEEENIKKLKKSYSNSPYPTLINSEDKFNNIDNNDHENHYYNTLFDRSNNTNSNQSIIINPNQEYSLDHEIEDYENIILNIEAATEKNNKKNRSYGNNIYVNKI